MDHYYEGRYGVVVDLDPEGTYVPIAEYAAYTTDQCIRAAILGCQPWDIDWTTE